MHKMGNRHSVKRNLIPKDQFSSTSIDHFQGHQDESFTSDLRVYSVTFRSGHLDFQ